VNHALAACVAALVLAAPAWGQDVYPTKPIALVVPFPPGGTTVLFATHLLEEADALATRIVVIDHGRIVRDGTPAEIKARAGGATIRLRADVEPDVLAAWPGVLRVGRSGARLEIVAREPQAVLRRLFASGVVVDEISVEGATGVLINVVGGPDMKMKEIQEAASLVQEQAHEDANIIFGASIDESLGENVKVTVIATGFDQAAQAAIAEAASRQQMAPQTLPASRMTGRGMAPEVPVISTRRAAHAHEARTTAAAPPSQPRLPIRERAASPASSSFPALDHDWDVPAFQRKGQ
jgi:hypothetical protein